MYWSENVCFAASLVLQRNRVLNSIIPSISVTPRRCTKTSLRAVPVLRTRSHRWTCMATPVGTDQNDVLLGELAFTEPDHLPALVQSRMNQLTDEFYSYVETKISSSTDLEERETLRLLVGAVKQLQDEVSSGKSFDASAAEATNNPILSSSAPNTTADQNKVAEAAYDQLIDRLARASEEDRKTGSNALAMTVKYEYDDIDKRFLDRLEDRIVDCADPEDLTAVKSAVAAEMGVRMREAAEKLKTVLSAPSSDDMRKLLEKLAVKGSLDDAFILLLQGNIEQAKNAGAMPAVQVMSSALEHAAMLKDARLPPEVRLIRRLLRTDDSEARISMLTDALAPNRAVLLADGTKSTGVRVDGKKFVQALRQLIERFGNMEKDFVQRLSEIGEESESVARKVFDMEDKDVQDLQDDAFNKRSVSVWDLEKVEIAEETEGRKAAWEGRLGNIPSGFDEHGKMQI